jgi:hypothetical protein
VSAKESKSNFIPVFSGALFIISVPLSVTIFYKIGLNIPEMLAAAGSLIAS